ncbi:MAG: glycosylase [Bacteroidetes bacterium]|nr:glycosylase [Bacteroidota bacterium]
MLKWEKLGKIFDLDKNGNETWMVEQAQNPFAIEMDTCVRVYFNTRSPKDTNGNSKSLAAYVDLDKKDLTKIISISQKPILEHGDIGTFDEFGIMAGSVIKNKSEFFLYYVGWTRKVSVPYNWEIGLATSDDGTKFKKIGKGPVIGSNYNEPYLQAGCSSVLFLNGVYHLFYTSGINWIEYNGKRESVYQIMKATSIDGILWSRNGKTILSNVIEHESQASPTVAFWNNKWHLFFSYRYSTNFRNKDRGYRIGYATSSDFENWDRHDNLAGIATEKEGWDSEMICYPNLFLYKKNIFLFYCGNDFGRKGFGLARLME